jgi:hypothetical protein
LSALVAAGLAFIALQTIAAAFREVNTVLFLAGLGLLSLTAIPIHIATRSTTPSRAARLSDGASPAPPTGWQGTEPLTRLPRDVALDTDRTG